MARIVSRSRPNVDKLEVPQAKRKLAFSKEFLKSVLKSKNTPKSQKMKKSTVSSVNGNKGNGNSKTTRMKYPKSRLPSSTRQDPNPKIGSDVLIKPNNKTTKPQKSFQTCKVLGRKRMQSKPKTICKNRTRVAHVIPVPTVVSPMENKIEIGTDQLTTSDIPISILAIPANNIDTENTESNSAYVPDVSDISDTETEKSIMRASSPTANAPEEVDIAEAESNNGSSAKVIFAQTAVETVKFRKRSTAQPFCSPQTPVKRRCKKRHEIEFVKKVKQGKRSTKRSQSPTDELYPVEKILGSRQVGHETQYLIKWKGDNWVDSWEPESNLTPDLIQYFLTGTQPMEAQDAGNMESTTTADADPTASTGMLVKYNIEKRVPVSLQEIKDARVGVNGFSRFGRGVILFNVRSLFRMDGMNCALVAFEQPRALELLHVENLYKFVLLYKLRKVLLRCLLACYFDIEINGQLD